MKKLLNKEEPISENESRLETDQTEQMETTHESSSFPNGKFRFPLIQDDNLLNSTTVNATETEKIEPKKSQITRLDTQNSISKPEITPMQGTYKRDRAIEKTKLTQSSSDLEPPKAPIYTIGRNRQSFQPTEAVSPVFGYERPNENLLKKQPNIDLVIETEHLSVVDAWLLKNGYLVSESMDERDTTKDEAQHYEADEIIENEKIETELCAREDKVEEIVEASVMNSVLQTEYIVDSTQEQMGQTEENESLLTSEKETEQHIENEEPEIVNEITQCEVVKEIDEEKQWNIEESEVVTEQEAMEETKNEVAESKVEIEQGTMEEQKREKRRSVPFNVIMLRQDKQKLTSEVAIEDTHPSYVFPSLGLLSTPNMNPTNDDEWLRNQEQLLNTTFENFHIGARVVHVTQGPAVTRFEVQPEPGVKVNKITNLSDDIKLNLAARDIRIEAPIPGKNTVGIEVPNRHSKSVFLREILRSPVFVKNESPLTVALGLDISGMPIVTDLRKMPHGLIAGATGSGKSVCINAILTSILYKALPHEVKLLLIDPKMVELAPYNDVPHLVSPVITDVKAATAALKWAVDEMEHRYELFAHAGARDLTRYNDLVNKTNEGELLPYIVIVIDELADLMMVSPADVEEAICRIAQKARACGIHLLVATQRPSVDVITGLIKANIPTRMAFTVSSQVDSRTIIDVSGAEKLLGRGDMLFLENGTSKPIRLQGVYVSDDEIERTVCHVRKQMKPMFLFKQDDLLAKVEQHETEDELFLEACRFVLDQGGASTSSLQRRFRIGYNRAARLIEEMEMQGIVSENRGTKPRDVLISEEDLSAMQENE